MRSADHKRLAGMRADVLHPWVAPVLGCSRRREVSTFRSPTRVKCIMFRIASGKSRIGCYTEVPERQRVDGRGMSKGLTSWAIDFRPFGGEADQGGRPNDRQTRTKNIGRATRRPPRMRSKKSPYCIGFLTSLGYTADARGPAGLESPASQPSTPTAPSMQRPIRKPPGRYSTLSQSSAQRLPFR